MSWDPKLVQEQLHNTRGMGIEEVCNGDRLLHGQHENHTCSGAAYHHTAEPLTAPVVVDNITTSFNAPCCYR